MLTKLIRVYTETLYDTAPYLYYRTIISIHGYTEFIYTGGDSEDDCERIAFEKYFNSFKIKESRKESETKSSLIPQTDKVNSIEEFESRISDIDHSFSLESTERAITPELKDESNSNNVSAEIPIHVCGYRCICIKPGLIVSQPNIIASFGAFDNNFYSIGADRT